jgi:hypothetical protein
MGDLAATIQTCGMGRHIIRIHLKPRITDVSHSFNKSTHFKGYILKPLSIPGQYDKKAARAVSNTSPKFRAQFL